VKRTLDKSARQALIKELSYWNNALRLCFEKTEVPLGSDMPNSTLDSVQARFNPRMCTKIRGQVRQVHGVVSQAWSCQSHTHMGNLRLSWHNTGEDSLMLPLPGSVNYSLSADDHLFALRRFD